MHIFIAGGAGFVGANLAIFLKRQYPHYSITCADNLSRNGSALNLPRLQEAGIDFIKADTRFAEQLSTERKIDLMVDAAAEPSVLAGLDNDLDYLVQTNFNGTVNLLQLARRHAADFIFLSTSRVYPVDTLNAIQLSKGSTRFKAEEKQPMPGCSAKGISHEFPLSGARSLYGATKLSSELMVQEFAAAFGMRTAVNRFGVIAGPWQMGKVDQGVVALWVAAHLFGRPLQYIGFGGQGLQVRDVLHIHDLCRLIDLQCHHMQQWSGQCFNAGGGIESSCSLAELTGICSEITGRNTSITRAETDRPGDIPWYVTDNAAITSFCGWKPQFNVQDIVRDTHAWMLENESQIKPIFAA